MESAEFTYRLLKGHPIVIVDGKRYLLATGMSRSVGDSPIQLGRRDIDLRPSYLGVTVANLRRRLGNEMAGVLGADLMAPFTVGICPDDRLVKFMPGPAAGETKIPVSLISGVPVVPADIGGKQVKLLLDTASSLSLLPDSALQLIEPGGQEYAYHPLAGRFRTLRYTLDISLGSHQRLFRAGVLPDALQSTLREDGIYGVLGSDLLEHFGLSLSFSEQMLVLRKRGSEPADRA